MDIISHEWSSEVDDVDDHHRRWMLFVVRTFACFRAFLQIHFFFNLVRHSRYQLYCRHGSRCNPRCVFFSYSPLYESWPGDGGSVRACKTFWCHDDEAARSVVLIHVPSPQKVLFLAFREETQRKWWRKLLCFSLEKARPAFLIHLQIIFELYIFAEITLICWFFSG